MASKKDRLSRKIRDEVEKNIGGEAGMSDLVDDVASRRSDQDSKETPPSRSKDTDDFSKDRGGDYRVIPEKKRESVYNITGDIRLDDYIESKDDDKFYKRAGFYRALGFGGLAFAVITVVWLFFSWLFGPSYKLGIAAVELTDSNIGQYLDTTSLILGPGQPIHIRFQWTDGDLSTDYLKILIQRKDKSGLQAEAELGRRPPQTANYIYFYGPLDPGDYKIEVFDRDGGVLKKKEISIR